MVLGALGKAKTGFSLESGSNLTSTKNAEGVNEIDFKIHETVDNVSDAKAV